MPSEKLERHRRAFLKVYAKGTSPEEVHAFIDQNEAIFRRQFTASYGILDLVSGNRQLLVEGRSGSGKTWHAIETARRFAQAEGADSGKEVLVLCYNLALGRLLTDLVARQPLERGGSRCFVGRIWQSRSLKPVACRGNHPVRRRTRRPRWIL
ncbi:MAG: hypothetical protein R3F31_18845 [Verrucomicrobiales bacterium]